MRLRVVAALLVAIVVCGVAPAVADAHDPIIVTPEQATPEQGPSFPDGTISFAVYGTIEVPGASAGMRVRFAEGDQLDLSLLIPDQAPENLLPDDSLPTLLLQAPDGSERTLTPTTRVPFAEEFSGTNYVRYLELSESAQAGEYRLTVFGGVPARFTLSFGTRETFGTPVENVVDRAGASDGIQTWYRTPPSSSRSAPTDTTVPVLIAPAPTDPVADTSAESSSDSTAPLVIAPAPTDAPTTTEPPAQMANAGGTLAIGLGAVLGVVVIVWMMRRRRGDVSPPQSNAE